MTTSYTLITPDGERFDFGEPGINVAQGIPDGFGLPPLDHNTMTVYQRPGAQLTSINIKPRVITITADLFGDCRLTLHKARAALFSALRWNRSSSDPPPASTLRYLHDGKTVDLKVHYLSDVISTQSETAQVIGIRLVGYDPMWYESVQTSTAVAAAQTPNVSYLIGLINGAWSAMGNGGTDTVYAIAVSPDGNTVYIGGKFIMWGGIAGANGVARYTISTATWSAMGTGIAGAGATVLALALDASGNLYVGGDFTTADGGAAANIAQYDTNTGVWSALGAGTDAAVYALVIRGGKEVYVGGGFTNPHNYIAMWDTAAWNDLAGDAMNSFVYGLATDTQNVYAIGNFTQADVGVAASYVARYYVDGDDWFAMGAGVGATGYAITIGPDGNIYAGGKWLTPGNSIAMWNGAAWYPLGSGIDDTVYALAFDSTGKLFVGGHFTLAGGITVKDIAAWNGTAWESLDAELPGNPTVYAVTLSGSNWFFGFTTAGAMVIAGATTTVTNTGSGDAYPIITVLGPGTLKYIANYTTGETLIFNFYIGTLETITIDLSPGVKTIVSDSRGNMMQYAELLPQSDFGTFHLAPAPIATLGRNTIRVMMTGTTVATAIWMMHYNAWLTADEAIQ